MQKFTRYLITAIAAVALFIPALTNAASNGRPKMVTENTAAFKAVAKTNWFQEGSDNAQHQLYVIAEPNCSACHFFYKNIQAYFPGSIFSYQSEDSLYVYSEFSFLY